MSSSYRPGLAAQWTFDQMNNGAAGHGAFEDAGFFAEGSTDMRVGDVEGRRAASLRLERGATDNPRGELVPTDMPSWAFDEGTHPRIGDTYWYGLSTFMPEDWAGTDGAMDLIMQWVGAPDFDRGEGWRHPTVGLGTRPEGDGTHFFLAIRSDPDDVTRKGDYAQERDIDLGPVNDSLGKWTDWVWKIDWDAGSDGALSLWRDGEQVVDLSGIGTAFNDDLGPYFKFGVYKWPWAGGGDTGTDSRTIHVDDVRVATGGDASYASVAPDGAEASSGTDRPSDQDERLPDGVWRDGEGRLDLTRLDADATSEGDAAFNFIGEAGFSGAAGELRTVATEDGLRLEGDSDGDWAADVQIELRDVWSLTAQDLVL